MRKIKLLILALALLGLNPMQGQSLYQAVDQDENQCELIMPHRVAPGQSIEVNFISDTKLLPVGQALKLLITNAQGEPIIERVSSVIPQSTLLFSGTTFTDVRINQEGMYNAVVVSSNGNTLAEKCIMVRDGAYTVKPLFELFTSSTCGPCAGANPIFDAVIEQNIGSHSVIKYQLNYPGAGDPYYNADVGKRITFYSTITGVPALIPNGNNGNPTSPYVMSQDFYNLFQGLPTDMQIVVTEAEIDNNNIVSIGLSINVAEAYDAGLKLCIAINEKTTFGNVGSNGETEFHHVMMKMLPDGNGTTLPALNPGTPYTLSQTYDMDLTFMEDANDLEVVVFVQHNTQKTIIQSETVNLESYLETYTVTYQIVNEDNQPIEGATIFMEDYGTKKSGPTGQAVYENVEVGTYAYEVNAAGLSPTVGTVVVNNGDVTVNVKMKSPNFYFYEDFSEYPDYGLPAGWSKLATGSDDVYCYAGEVILFRQNPAMSPVVLISPLVNLDLAGTLIFDHGKASFGDVEAEVGYMTSPTDFESFVGFLTFTPSADWNTGSIEVSDINWEGGEVYLAWRLNSGTMTYFSIDNVRLTHIDDDDDDTGVGIHEQIVAKIYPNPASGYVNVVTSAQNAVLRVMDIQGRVVQSLPLTTNNQLVDISNLSQGLYFFVVKSEQAIQTHKVIVN